MKVSSIEINNYLNFKDFKIDLTYPKSHKKAGLPLDKVCIIGQGGTGKTTILRLIKWFISSNRKIGKNIYIDNPAPQSIRLKLHFNNLEWVTMNGVEGNLIKSFQKNGKIIGVEDFKSERNILRQKHKPYLINFPTDMPEGTDKELEVFRKPSKDSEELIPISVDEIIDFTREDLTIIWKHILREIQIHNDQERRIRKKFSEAALNGTDEEIHKWRIELEKFKKSPNPLFKLANECLNPILSQLGLKVLTEIDTENTSSEQLLTLQTLSGRVVPNELWSTGTKQIINILAPIFQLKPKNAVILIDEVERSLYPNMQRNVVDSVCNISGKSQVFFATHSPVIASAFEPCERIILYFDENWNVQWKNGVSPVGDDPNDLLKKDFGMQNLMHDKGIAEYKRYLDYKIQIKNEQDEGKKQALVVELTKLAEEYNF